MVFIDKFPLAASGRRYIIGCLGLLAMAIALKVCVLVVILLLALFFMLWFFRDPGRQNTSAPPLALVSPADGRIVALEEVEHPQMGRVLLLSIFMNVFSVHVNRLPIAGTVTNVHHIPGGFQPADRPGARVGNERLELTLRLDDGREIMVTQVAGLVAQYIECWVSAPHAGQRGSRYGMIRFGSRVDLYLPTDTRIAASRGQKVRAGETVIGIMADV